MIASDVTALIGRTPLVRVRSLSELSGCDIYAKCEFLNPGGSIKDRAALQMVDDAIAEGALRPGMTIVEGTAGNTGIGLALVARARGFRMLAVMPNDQAKEKERAIALYGGELKLVPPVPFKDPNHFYHAARALAEAAPERYWWADQFENPSNWRAHYRTTGPEILAALEEEETNTEPMPPPLLRREGWAPDLALPVRAGRREPRKIDAFVSAAGTGGTIGGVSKFLKERAPRACTFLVDPEGSGLRAYVTEGEIRSTGSSFTEGIGIMRLTANFQEARVDDAFTLPDQDLYTVAQHVRAHDGLLVGSSSALNLAGALKAAAILGPGKTIVTLLCDGGERSAAKLYNPEFLASKGIRQDETDAAALFARYRAS